jgi:hypothetical protein
MPMRVMRLSNVEHYTHHISDWNFDGSKLGNRSPGLRGHVNGGRPDLKTHVITRWY